MNEGSRSGRDALASLALLALAAAIAYLAYALIRLGNQVPAVLQQVDAVNQQTAETIEKIQPVIEQLPVALSLVQEINQQIPDILAESEQYRKLVPSLLNEVEQVRGEIPPLLKRVDRLQDQVGQFQKSLPEVLHTIENTNQVVADTNRQIAAIRPYIPQALEQVALTRDAIPEYLTRAENIVANSREISEEAGKGAVSGFIKGILSTPFDLLKDTTNLLRSGLQNSALYTDADMALAADSAKRILRSNEKEVNWNNRDNGNSGSVTLLREYQQQNQPCKLLRFSFQPKSGKKEVLEKHLCLNADNKWDNVDASAASKK